MIINAPQKLTEQVDRTSTEQVPNMLTEQLSAPLTAIIKVIGTEQYSLKALMEKIGLKHRPTFYNELSDTGYSKWFCNSSLSQ